MIYWGKSRLVFSHNLNHDQFCNTVDIQVIVSGHVETVVKLVNTGVKPDFTVHLDVDVDDFYKTVGE